MKLIKLHFKWMKKGRLDGEGLCVCIPEEYNDILELLHPTDDNLIELSRHDKSCAFWGSDKCFLGK